MTVFERGLQDQDRNHTWKGCQKNQTAKESSFNEVSLLIYIKQAYASG